MSGRGCYCHSVRKPLSGCLFIAGRLLLVHAGPGSLSVTVAEAAIARRFILVHARSGASPVTVAKTAIAWGFLLLHTRPRGPSVSGTNVAVTRRLANLSGCRRNRSVLLHGRSAFRSGGHVRGLHGIRKKQRESADCEKRKNFLHRYLPADSYFSKKFSENADFPIG